jgi:hypothetical protein
MKPHQEGMIAGCLEDVLFCLDPVYVLVVCYEFFLYHLQE